MVPPERWLGEGRGGGGEGGPFLLFHGLKRLQSPGGGTAQWTVPSDRPSCRSLGWAVQVAFESLVKKIATGCRDQSASP